MARIAVVEDEAALREDIALYLRAEGHEVRQAGCGTELNPVLAEGVDIVVLDVNLPEESGFDIAARLRTSCNPGIIMLTARRLEDDRLTGLNAGADIYLSKPVSFRELAAHVRALCRRLMCEPGTPDAAQPQPWLLHRAGWHLVTPAGAAVPLSNLEMRLLLRLAETPQQPVDRNTLVGAVYDTDLDYDSRALDALVRRLKRKVERMSGAVLPIQTLYATGFLFSEPLRVAVPHAAD